MDLDKFKDLEKSIIQSINDKNIKDKDSVRIRFNNADVNVKKGYLKRLKNPLKYVLGKYSKKTENQLNKSLNNNELGQSVGLIKLLDSGNLISKTQSNYYKELLKSKRQSLEDSEMTEEDRELQKELLEIQTADWGKDFREEIQAQQEENEYTFLSSYSKAGITSYIF